MCVYDCASSWLWPDKPAKCADGTESREHPIQITKVNKMVMCMCFLFSYVHPIIIPMILTAQIDATSLDT